MKARTTRSQHQHADDHECLVVSLDIGTTGVKAGVVNAKGRILAVAERRQVIVADGPGWREHIPAQMQRSAIAALTEVISAHDQRDAICSIAVTGSSGSFMMLDRTGSPITNILTWQDRRTSSIPLTAGVHPRRYREVTGATLGPSIGLSRMLWLRERRPEVIRDSDRVVTPQGYVLMSLGAAEPAIEPSVAAVIGPLDLGTLDWSSELLDGFRLAASMLPKVVPTGSIVGRVGARAARRLGLRPGIDLVLAATDGVCAQLGAGVVSEGQLYGYLGSALAVSGPMQRPIRDPEGHLTTAPGFGPDWWRLIGLGTTGASAIEWLARASGRSVLRDLENTLARSRAGAGGVLFLPSLAGAGAPIWNAAARGAFLGLTFSAGRPEMVRAVLEGVVMEMRAMYEAIGVAGIDAAGLRLTGGGTRSLGWCRIVASAIPGEVSRVVDAHPGLRGAAFYAVAAHTLRLPAAIAAANLPAIEAVQGDPAERPVYDELAEAYVEAQRAIGISPLNRRLARIALEGNPVP